jgi:hypothetical protein
MPSSEVKRVRMVAEACICKSNGVFHNRHNLKRLFHVLFVEAASSCIEYYLLYKQPMVAVFAASQVNSRLRSCMAST